MVTTIILSIILGITLCFTALYFYGIHLAKKAEAFKQAAKTELELYKEKVEIERHKTHHYMLFVNADFKLFYTDASTTCMVNGIVDYYEIYPEEKGKPNLFLDQDPEICNIMFVGPNRKFK